MCFPDEKVKKLVEELRQSKKRKKDGNEVCLCSNDNVFDFTSQIFGIEGGPALVQLFRTREIS